MTDKEPDLDNFFEPVRMLAINKILCIHVFDFIYDLSLTDKQSKQTQWQLFEQQEYIYEEVKNFKINK